MARAGVWGAAPRRYARALFEVARDRGALREAGADMDVVDQVLSHPEVQGWLGDPRVAEAQKRELLLGQVGSRVHPVTRGLLEVLVRRRRYEVLAGVPAAWRGFLDEHEGRLRGLVESAVPLEPAQRARIEAALGARMGKHVSLEGRVVPSLLGGVRVTLAGVRYNGSVRARLEDARRCLESAELAAR